MRRTLLSLAAVLLTVAPVCGAAAQPHAVHVEALGPGLIGSANYERIVGENFSARVGVGYFPGFDIGSQLLAPVMLNVLAGKGEHRLEAGAGVVLAYALNRGIEEDESVPEHGFRRGFATATLAYRLEPGTESALHGSIYRIGLTPMFFGGRAYPWVGASGGFYLSALGGR
jgi:hypothetical protein